MAPVIRAEFGKPAGRRKADTITTEAVPDYRLHLAIAFSEPLIWRLVQVPGNCTLEDLHRIIQICMGWSNGDDHRFLVGKVFYHAASAGTKHNNTDRHNETRVRLYQLEAGMPFIFSYLYDGGQGWELEIILQQIVSPPTVLRPVLLDGARAAPPETIGDIHYYQDLLNDLVTAGVEDDGVRIDLPDYPGFVPAYCDIEEINAALVRAFSPAAA